MVHHAIVMSGARRRPERTARTGTFTTEIQKHRQMACVTIVGGAGFIGTSLTTGLRSAGHTVRIADVGAAPDSDVDYRQVDVRDRDDLLAALSGSEVVYNLAAVHRDDIRPATRYHEVNVTGATNVCDACAQLGIHHLVFTSSVAVYGDAPPDTDEDRTPAPVNPYGRSKLLAERAHKEWQAQDPSTRSLVIVRPTVVFGEGNRGNVYRLLRLIAGRRFAMIGDGTNRKSMAYVGNLSQFLTTALARPPGVHVFNYVDKSDLSMQALAELVSHALGQPPLTRLRIPYPVGYLAGVACDLVASMTGTDLPISADRVRKFCASTTYSADRLHGTGFQAPFSLREALVRTIKHERGVGSL